MTKEIHLTHGKVALVSDHRYEYLSQFSWTAYCVGKQWYAGRYVIKSRKDKKYILMHREITNAPDGMEVDHRDHDGLNNTDENLRICTRAQNVYNTRNAKNNSTGFRGVSRSYNRYYARITVNGRKIYLGQGGYSTAEEAARAYDDGAKKYHGDFALLNFSS